jgi:small subunit ribosomal protein S17
VKERTVAEEETSVGTSGLEKPVRVKSGKKEFIGIVQSDKMNKTIVVSVETTTLHRAYKKFVVRIKKVKAHDEKNEAKIGDRVRVVECRPISKEKCWKLDAILERAK